MSTTATRRQIRLIARARKRMHRALLSATSIIATAAVVATGLVTGSLMATAASGDATTPTLGGYTGPRMVQLSEGTNSYQLAVDEDGVVWGWGVNSSRQVRGDSTAAAATPVAVTAVADVLDAGESIVSVSGAISSSFALTSAGRVISWGANTNYALGRNTSVAAPGPVLTAPGVELTGITKIASDGYSTLALDETGHVWAWGYNGWGQLGTGTTAAQRYAVQIADSRLSGVTDIDNGRYGSIAVANGVAYAWGHNNGGNRYLGTASTASNVMVPTPVATTSGMTGRITQVSAAYGHLYFALDEAGQVWSWGRSLYGSLGRDGSAQLPGRVLDGAGNALTGVTQISAGDWNAVAVATDSTVYAWGRNQSGQLGIGSTTDSARAVKVRNFDLDAGTYGAELTGVESVAANIAHTTFISKVGDDDGVVSASGHYQRIAQGDNRNRDVPNLVWKYEHSFAELPLSLVPRDGKTYPDRVVNDANLVQRDAGTLNYGVAPFELNEVTAESTAEFGADVTYALSGYCSMNQTTKVVTVNNAGYCDITRSFPGTALVKTIPTESWRVYIGKLVQDIEALGTTDEPGALFEGLDADSDAIALPNLTDAPANQGSLRYTITQGNPEVCKLSAYDGSVTNSQRYLQPLGEGTCELTVTQAGSTNYEQMTKIVSFEIGEGAVPQSLDLSALGGMRYHASDNDHALPTQTTVGGEPVAYEVVSGPCTVDGTTLTATGAGACVLGVTAPAGTGGTNGYLAYADTQTVVIGKGIQTLDSIVDELATLESANSASAALPATSNEGIALSWSAETAAGSTFVDACSYDDADQLVHAGAETERNVDGVMEYAECTITAQNAGDANWEPFSYQMTTEISERELQNLSLAALDGKKFGDAPFDLPAETAEGQPVTYAASGSCTVDGNTVTIQTGGSCVISATAPGTDSASDPDAGEWYRPLSITTTAPVATLGQYVSGMPALNALKVGSISGALPVETAQGKTVDWAVTTPEVCEIVADADTGRERVRILADGDCTITGSAPGDASYTPFGYELTVKALINYESLNAEIAAAIAGNDDGAGNPRYTSDTWNDYQHALDEARAAQEPNGVSQANVDQLTQALVDAKEALVDLTELRDAYESRVTDASPYTPASWADYEQAVADALDVLENDADATAAEVTATAEALRSATGDLVLRADKVALQAEVDNTEVLVESDFAARGWDDYQSVLADSEAVLADPNATQAEVDDALDALRAALEALVDISELRDAVDHEDEVNRQEGDYTPGSWSEYVDARDVADAVLADPEATQAEVDNALAALQEAANALVWTAQLNPTLAATISGHAVGDAPVRLPRLTDRGADISYEVATASAAICEIVDGRLIFTGFGDCEVSWSAPAIGDFPASTGSELAPTAPGIQLVVDGAQVLDGDALEVGQLLTARGGGLEPGTELRVELRPGGTVLGAVLVGADGTASVTVTVPDGIRPGDYTISAHGVSEVDGSALVRTAGVAISNLAFTGADVLPIAVGALLLLLAGVGVLLLVRRRAGSSSAA